jgi:hypothetical protein
MIDKEKKSIEGPINLGRVHLGHDTTGEKKQRLTARCQATTGHEAGNNGIPCVLLLPESFYSTVECGEHATPNTKVATGDGCTGFYSRKGASKALALYIVASVGVINIIKRGK